MIITKKKAKDVSKIHLKVDNIKETEQTTFLELLGVTIDQQLSFSEHVTHIINVKSIAKKLEFS